MKLVGLTGGIGSGKSTVARILADLGATIVDADAIVHELQAKGTPLLAQLVDVEILGVHEEIEIYVSVAGNQILSEAFESYETTIGGNRRIRAVIHCRHTVRIDAHHDRGDGPFLIENAVRVSVAVVNEDVCDCG